MRFPTLVNNFAEFHNKKKFVYLQRFWRPITIIYALCVQLYIYLCAHVCVCVFDTTYDGKQAGAPERHTRHPAVAGGLCFYLFHCGRDRHHHKHEVTVGGCVGGSRPSGATHTCPIPYVGRRRYKPGTHIRFNGVPKI